MNNLNAVTIEQDKFMNFKNALFVVKEFSWIVHEHI